MMTSIPAFHISGRSKAAGKGLVFISSRQDAVSAGTFLIAVNVQFNPVTDAYPSGSVKIKTDMSDSAKAEFISTSIDLINSHGKHNPTIFLTGRCRASSEKAPKGLRYWLMIADNRSERQKGSPDIVSFVINDRNGNRVAYGTGQLKAGNITVAPN